MADALRKFGKLAEIEFSLFLKFENADTSKKGHQVVFLPADSLDNDAPLSVLFEQGLNFKRIADVDRINFIMVVRLGGNFHSNDSLRFESIRADSTGIYLRLVHTRVESQDGVPFPVRPYLLIPIKPYLLKYIYLRIGFQTFVRDFLTAEKREDININIPHFEFYFSE